MGETAIPVSKAVRNDLRDDKPDGVPWNDYLRGLHEDGEIVVEPAELDPETAEAIIETIGAEVGGASVDDGELAREVARQIDYAALADRVADELEARLR